MSDPSPFGGWVSRCGAEGLIYGRQDQLELQPGEHCTVPAVQVWEGAQVERLRQLKAEGLTLTKSRMKVLICRRPPLHRSPPSPTPNHITISNASVIPLPGKQITMTGFFSPYIGQLFLICNGQVFSILVLPFGKKTTQGDIENPQKSRVTSKPHKKPRVTLKPHKKNPGRP